VANEKKTPGCGWTQPHILDQVVALASAQYEKGLQDVGMRPTSSRRLLVDSYQRGMRAAVRHLVNMGVLTVMDDPK
jgi:hypothetical protein